MSPVKIELCPNSNLNLNKGAELVTLESLRLQCHSCLSKQYYLPKELGRSRYVDQLGRLFKKGMEHDRRRHRGMGEVVIRAALSKKG